MNTRSRNRVYAALPEEAAASLGSNTIPAKKLHHGELHATSTCHQWGKLTRKEMRMRGDNTGHICEGD